MEQITAYRVNASKAKVDFHWSNVQTNQSRFKSFQTFKSFVILVKQAGSSLNLSSIWWRALAMPKSFLKVLYLNQYLSELSWAFQFFNWWSSSSIPSSASIVVVLNRPTDFWRQLVVAQWPKKICFCQGTATAPDFGNIWFTVDCRTIFTSSITRAQSLASLMVNMKFHSYKSEVFSRKTPPCFQDLQWR